MTVQGLDLSNYQGQVSSERAACLASAGIRHVVVRASLEDMARVNLARQQIAALQGAGIDVSLYLWVYFTWNPTKTITDALREYGPTGCAWYWLDVEELTEITTPAEHVAWLKAAVAALRDAGRSPGIYSGAWYWNDPRYMNSSAALRDLPLWAAQYDGIPDLSVWTGFGGWSALTGKQYQDKGALCGISPLDLDVFDERVLPAPQPSLSDVKLGLVAKILAEDWVALRDDAAKLAG